MPPSPSSSSSSGAPVNAFTFWVGNAQVVAQVDTVEITAVPAAGGGVLTFQISDKLISYTTLNTDTTATAAQALQALLAGAGSTVPEFNEITFSLGADGTSIVATAATPGLPFTLTTSGSGGASLSQVHTTANGSTNDAGNNNNWIRNLPTGQVYSIPINGDDVVIADSSISILYNLAALANVQFNSLTRYNTFTGQIGLPENNPAGYYEYRPTYFQFAGVSGAIAVTVGIGPGNGAGLERYNAGNQACNWLVTGSQVRILNQNVTSTYTVNGGTLDVATNPGETANVSGGVLVVNSGTLNVGQGATFAGQLTVDASSVAFCNTTPQSIVSNGGTITLNSASGTVQSVNVTNGTTISWNSAANIITLTMTFNSTLDKTGDPRTVTITNSTIDATCQILDPWNAIQRTNPTTVNGVVSTGPFTFANRTVLVK